MAVLQLQGYLCVQVCVAFLASRTTWAACVVHEHGPVKFLPMYLLKTNFHPHLAFPVEAPKIFTCTDL